MPKTTLTWLLLTVLAVVSQACAPGSPSAPDPGTINTAIAQTQAAAPTRTSEPEIPVTGPDTPTTTISPSPEQPTPTATALVLPSPVFTPTAGTPQIRVVIPTNCRLGPGVAYDRVGGLQPGQVAEIVGRHAERNYWIIREPNRNVICWLWGEYATVTGDVSTLPFYTAPPTPTPLPTATATLTPLPTGSFTASYNGLESCTGTGWWIELLVRNTGDLPFQSMSLTVTDTATNTVIPLEAASFTNRNGCSETDTRPNIPAAETRIVSSLPFGYDPTGNRLIARITLCTGTALNGACRTQAIEFTP
ncbi:MAG TPA: hypothetical protein VK900_05160 [Anaerolineales bacterium]|nr:hypothetical protein [Anaerolineales bacterium]